MYSLHPFKLYVHFFSSYIPILAIDLLLSKENDKGINFFCIFSIFNKILVNAIGKPLARWK